MTTAEGVEGSPPDLAVQRERMVVRRRTDLDRLLAQTLEMFPDPVSPADADRAIREAWHD